MIGNDAVAARSGATGGTSRVLERPGCGALAMTATAQLFILYDRQRAARRDGGQFRRVLRAVGLAFFEIAFDLAEAVRDLCEAEHVPATGPGKRIQRSGFHFDRENVFGAGGIDCLFGFAERCFGGPGRAGVRMAAGGRQCRQDGILDNL